MTDVEIHVLGKTVRLLQPGEGFRTSLDSVFVAAACPAKPGDRVLDAGCGVGGAGFCLLQRVPGLTLTGVDITPDFIRMARENAVLNGRQAHADFIHADIRDFRDADRFDHVLCNPPYFETGTYTPSPQDQKAVALGHLHDEIDVSDWIDAAFHNLKPGGGLTLIHRANQTDRIIQSFGRRFGAVEIIPLWPRAGQAAKRVVIRARKERKTPAVLHPGIVLHEADGAYTAETDAILRGMAGI